MCVSAMRRVILPVFLLLIYGMAATAQPALEWVTLLDYDGNLDTGTDVVLDEELNIYATGAATTVVNSVVGTDFCTARLNSTGDTLWVRYWGDPAGYSDAATSIALDDAGNVIVCGISQSSLWNTNLAIVKYDAVGNQLWAATTSIGGGAEVAVMNVVIKGNHIYACASSVVAGYAALVVKYDSDGNTVWTRQFEGPFFTAHAAAVGVDEQDNVYLAGYSIFDLATGSEMMILKYNADGDQQWLAHHPGPVNATEQTSSMLLSASGEAVLVGRSDSVGTTSFCVIKFDHNGSFQWSNKYRPPGDVYAQPYDAAGDAGGDFCVTGFASGSSLPNFLTAKFDADGNLYWAKEFNNPLVNREAIAQSCTMDVYGNVYVTGEVNDSIGLSGYQWDIFTVKYNASGLEEWNTMYHTNDAMEDKAFVVLVDANEDVIVSGYSANDMILIKYSQPTAVQTYESEVSFVLSPNPSPGHVLLCFSAKNAGMLEYDLITSAGAIITCGISFFQPGSNTIPLDFTSFIPGTYILWGKTGYHTFSHCVILQ